MVQQRCLVSLLIQGPLAKGKLTILTGELACPIYGMEDTSAEFFSAAFRQATHLPIVEQLAGKFHLFIRASTLDKAGGCQRFIRNHCVIFPSSIPLPSCCFIHTSHTAAKKAAAVQNADVSGMFAYVDSMQEGMHLKTFQQDLAEAILSATTVHLGAVRPSDSPELLWKERMLDKLLPGNSLDYTERKWVLNALMNGKVGDGFSRFWGLEEDAALRAARAQGNGRDCAPFPLCSRGRLPGNQEACEIQGCS